MDASCDPTVPGSPAPQCVSASTSSAIPTRSSRRSASRHKPQSRGSSASSCEDATEAVKTDLSQLLQLDTLGGTGGIRTLPPDALTTVTSLVAGLPEEVVPLIIARSTARRGKGGRQPGLDPHLDPSVDPRRAKRILANRESAARSKLKQKVLAEKARMEHLLAAKRAAAAEAELGTLKRKVVALEAENQQLEAAAAALISFAHASPGVSAAGGDASGCPADAAAAGDAAADAEAAAGGGGEGGMSTSEGSCAAPCQAPRTRRARKASWPQVKVEPVEVAAPDHPMSDAATYTCRSANVMELAAQGLPPPAFAYGLAPFSGEPAGADHAPGARAGQGMAEQLPMPSSPRITTSGAGGPPGSPKLPGSPPRLPYGQSTVPASSGLLQLSPAQPPAAPLPRYDSWWSSSSSAFDAGLLAQGQQAGPAIKTEPAAPAQGAPAAWLDAAEAAAAAAAQGAYAAALAAAAEAAAAPSQQQQQGSVTAAVPRAPGALPSCFPFNQGAWHNLTLPSSVGVAGPSPATAAAAAGAQGVVRGTPLLSVEAGPAWSVEEDAEERCLVDIPLGMRSPPGSLPMVWGCSGVGGEHSTSNGLFGEMMVLEFL